jgi:hypothetical protein
MSSAFDDARQRIRAAQQKATNPDTWSEEGTRRVNQYAGARPYIARAAKFGVPTALIAKVYQGTTGAASSTPAVGKGLRSVPSRMLHGARRNLPIVATTAAMGAGVIDKKLENMAKENRRLKEVNQTFQKKAAVRLHQRLPGEGVFSEVAESTNLSSLGQVINGLFARAEAMHKRTHEQLGDLFPAGHSDGCGADGRARKIGITAQEASKRLDRAFG